MSLKSGLRVVYQLPDKYPALWRRGGGGPGLDRTSRELPVCRVMVAPPPTEDAEPPRSGLQVRPRRTSPSVPLSPDDLGPVAFDLSCWTSKQAPVAAGTCLVGGCMRRLCATHGFLRLCW